MINPNVLNLYGISCNCFDKDIIHGRQLFIVTNHLIPVENKSCQFIAAYIVLFFDSQIDELMIGLP